MARLSYLWPYLRPHKRKLALGIAAIFASVVFGLFSPLVIGDAVDSLRREITQSSLIFYAALVVGLALAQGVFSYLQRLLLVSMSRDVEFELRNTFFSTLETQPPAFFQDYPTGDLMARATNDLQAVRALCGPAIMYSANTVFTGVGALLLMARIDVGLTALSLIAMPLVAVATKVFGERIHVLFGNVQERFSGISSRVQESLSGVRVVRAYAQERREEEEFRQVNQEYVAGNRRLILWQSAFHPLLQALVGLGFIIVLWYGGTLVIRGVMTVGELVTFQLFLGRLVWPMIAIGWVINLVQRGTASLNRIREVVDVVPAIREVPPVADPEEIRGSVAVRDLTFAYREDLAPVLRGIDFQVPAGRTVAIVGRTGSGKSTLLNVLPRLIDPPAETVFLDGIDVRHLPLARLRGAIGMVPQETFLFSASIRDNVALGRAGATPQEVEEAVHLAGMDQDVASFPKGLDTLVGERGITLSGGQKQRVTLARALLRDPRILILDDCLSAVDTQTEEQILQNLRRVFVGRTVFLVSHRISTVREADIVLVLDEGRIVERGTHDQLLAVGGIYADLYQRQMLEEELATA